VSELDGGTTNIGVKIVYSDGFGRSLQEKIEVETGLGWVKQTDGSFIQDPCTPRYLVSGRTIYNNKEKPVKQYEPFYSGSPNFENESFLTFGVSPTIIYDPLGRVVRTNNPNGTHSKVEFTPWSMKSYDENDTILETGYYDDGVLDPTLNLDEYAEDALKKAKTHADLSLKK
jgi:hypothetical protein